MTDPIQNLYTIYLKSTGICTDTRKIEKGNLFFALQGPNFNANKFAEQALESGAIAAVIDDIGYAQDDRYVVVQDALEALQQLAKHHREQLSIPVIGITGSNGKTTTKELMLAALSAQYKTFATRGNLNNHIGVPLSLLEVTSSHEMAIIEMGANHVGEIASYCEIAQPTHGIITNIGKAHIGEFGGFENIIRGKSELFDYLRKNGGIPFINTSDRVLQNMKKRFANAVTYPNEGDNLAADLVASIPYLSVKVGAETVATRLTGAYNFTNVVAALCVAQFFEVPMEQALKKVEAYVPSNMRSQIIKTDDYTIILDAYNANPSSMEAALRNLSTQSGKTACILGDMFELGDETADEHTNLVSLCQELQIDQRYYCGQYISQAGANDDSAHVFDSKDALKSFLQEAPIAKNSTILIKGSRKNALEELMSLF
jgi:UDP-N-acetylmuramoyl-tripeptide--D-alanyl-D-alanine ligase